VIGGLSLLFFSVVLFERNGGNGSISSMKGWTTVLKCLLR
jgi:hypothetical protein